jgi:hypothetical protein
LLAAATHYLLETGVRVYFSCFFFLFFSFCFNCRPLISFNSNSVKYDKQELYYL